MLNQEEIINKVFQETNIARPRINLIFAKKCLDKYSEEIEKIINDLNEVDFKGEIEGKVLLISKEELLSLIKGKEV